MRAELNQSDFDRLLESLHPDRQRAGEEYEKLRYRLILFFDRRGSSDAHTQADVALDRVARKLQEETVRDLVGFCYGVARNLLLEELHKPAAVRLDESHEIVRPFQTDVERENRYGCLVECLSALSPDERRLLLEYYGDEDQLKPKTWRRVMAKTLTLGASAFRTRVYRLRRQVGECCRTCARRRG